MRKWHATIKAEYGKGGEKVTDELYLKSKEIFMNFFYKDALQLAGGFYTDDPTGSDFEIYKEIARKRVYEQAYYE